mmetsp:Transcript_2043/g.13186  ORF Transcript_2043/g.13186 Transcript_2043/m.13186 type:complete len:267 (-) Transcript_2043:743-1543(-)
MGLSCPGKPCHRINSCFALSSTKRCSECGHRLAVLFYCTFLLLQASSKIFETRCRHGPKIIFRRPRIRFTPNSCQSTSPSGRVHICSSGSTPGFLWHHVVKERSKPVVGIHIVSLICCCHGIDILSRCMCTTCVCPSCTTWSSKASACDSRCPKASKCSWRAGSKHGGPKSTSRCLRVCRSCTTKHCALCPASKCRGAKTSTAVAWSCGASSEERCGSSSTSTKGGRRGANPTKSRCRSSGSCTEAHCGWCTSETKSRSGWTTCSS